MNITRITGPAGVIVLATLTLSPQVLAQGNAGTLKSTYTRRIRIFRDGVYQVKVAGHDDHVDGFSRLRTLAVH